MDSSIWVIVLFAIMAILSDKLGKKKPPKKMPPFPPRDVDRTLPPPMPEPWGKAERGEKNVPFEIPDIKGAPLPQGMTDEGGIYREPGTKMQARSLPRGDGRQGARRSVRSAAPRRRSCHPRQRRGRLRTAGRPCQKEKRASRCRPAALHAGSGTAGRRHGRDTGKTKGIPPSFPISSALGGQAVQEKPSQIFREGFSCEFFHDKSAIL